MAFYAHETPTFHFLRDPIVDLRDELERDLDERRDQAAEALAELIVDGMPAPVVSRAIALEPGITLRVRPPPSRIARHEDRMSEPPRSPPQEDPPTGGT